MEEKPLYCFKVNWKTFEIERHIITKYVVNNSWSSSNPVYKFDIGYYKQHIHENQLDTVTRDKYVTFTDDYETAKKMILQAYKERLATAERNYLNTKNAVEKLMGDGA